MAGCQEGGIIHGYKIRAKESSDGRQCDGEYLMEEALF